MCCRQPQTAHISRPSDPSLAHSALTLTAVVRAVQVQAQTFSGRRLPGSQAFQPTGTLIPGNAGSPPPSGTTANTLFSQIEQASATLVCIKHVLHLFPSQSLQQRQQRLFFMPISAPAPKVHILLPALNLS